MQIELGQSSFRAAIRRAMRKAKPLPYMSLSEWSLKFARLPKGESNRHGKFSFRGFEYQIEPMDCVSDPKVRKTILMWASQMGKTRIQFNGIGFFAHYDPSAQLMIYPSVDNAEKVSRARIAPFIEETPVLKDIFPDPKSRDSGNTILQKQYPGGQLILVGANAPSGLASFPIRVLWPDEVDRWEDSAGEEGAPLPIAEKRQSKFPNRVTVMASSPGIEQTSVIEPEFRNSDQRYYFVPCPHCGTKQILKWANLKWPSPTNGAERHDPKGCWYECEECCGVILERHKAEMLRKGEWRATARSIDGKTAGFHLSCLYALEPKWEDLIVEWVNSEGKPQDRKVFINTRLAETWKVRGETAEVGEIQKRAEVYPCAEDGTRRLPEGVLVLTAGVDTQKDRFEVSIWGWGLNEQAWLIDHKILRGDPSKKPLQDELVEALSVGYQHSDGDTLRPVVTLLDAFGRYTKEMYDFTRRNEMRRIYACKGVGGVGRPAAGGATRVGVRKNILLYPVGVDTVKETIYHRLREAKPEEPGYIHFPIAACADTGYFAQLTSEQLVEEKKGGKTQLVWVKKPGVRNETLDCAVYAFAAKEVLNPALEVIAKKRGRALVQRVEHEQQRTQIAPEAQETAQEVTKVSNFKASRRRRGYATGWKQ